MLEFIQNNLGTIVIAALLLLVIALIVAKQISDKKKGKSSCGCGCGSCPNAGLCHGKREDNSIADTN